MRLGFTGSRKGLSDAQAMCFGDIVVKMRLTEFHHGDCVGADEQALNLVYDLVDPWTVCHPPTDPKARAHTRNSQERAVKPYLVRNHDIVDDTDHLIACPGKMEEEGRSGTWATVRHARKTGKPITIIWRDGSVKQESAHAVTPRGPSRRFASGVWS